MNEASVVEKEKMEYPVLNIEEVEYCKLKVGYIGDPEIVEEKIEEALVSLRKIQIPGFRKGKAPDSAIKIRLRPQIDQFIAREMASVAVDDVVFETDIKIITQPVFSNMSIKGNNFSCNIELVKRPEFELSNFKFEIPNPHVEFDEEALTERSLFNLRLRVGEMEPYEEDDIVEVGDQLTLSFEATIDGEVFDGNMVEGELYQVGADRWAGWDDHILGMKAGETKSFDFIFESGPETLLGKKAKFSVTVHMGTKRRPHPIDDDFFKVMGVKSLEDIMEKLKAISKASIQKGVQQEKRNQVAIKLVEANKFKVPDFIIENEASNLAMQAGLVFKDLDDGDREKFSEQAEKNTRLSLILDSVRETEPDSVLNDVEAQNHLVQYFTSQGQDPSIINNPQARSYIGNLINSIRNEFTLQWITDQSTVIE